MQQLVFDVMSLLSGKARHLKIVNIEFFEEGLIYHSIWYKVKEDATKLHALFQTIQEISNNF